MRSKVLSAIEERCRRGHRQCDQGDVYRESRRQLGRFDREAAPDGRHPTICPAEVHTKAGERQATTLGEPSAALRGARLLACLHNMSRVLRSVRLAFVLPRDVFQQPDNCSHSLLCQKILQGLPACTDTRYKHGSSLKTATAAVWLAICLIGTCGNFQLFSQ